MAANIKVQGTPQSKPNNPLKRFGDFLFHPRSTNRDAAFRERTIRITITVYIVIQTINLLTSFFYFHDALTFPSFPAMELVTLVLAIFVAIAISRQKVFIAGALVVALIEIGVTIIALIPDTTGSLGVVVMVGFMIAILAAALLLPRSWIFPVAILSIVVQIVTLNLTRTATDSATQNLIAGSIGGFIIEAAFLWLLRGEFDARLLAEREQAKIADEARHEAERANQAKSKFLANMTHEFRTPLNAIIGYTDLMLMGVVGEIPEKPKELLGFVKTNAQRHLGLVNEVLDMSAIEAGRVDVRLKPENIRELINHTVESLRSLTDQKHLTLKTVIEPNAPEMILTDGKKVEQIVINLIGNAVKFTETGGIEAIIGSRNDQEWYFKIKDSGRGMPQDAKEYIFETFRQVDASDSADHKGTGLGLAITLGLVKVMGGNIDVETELGKGSTFIVNLPRSPKEGSAQNVALGSLGTVQEKKTEVVAK